MYRTSQRVKKMEELEQILLRHARLYPAMEPTDAVKLIYQNEFGGGHLIRDPEAARNYLRREYAATAKNTALPQWEDIGNGIIRVFLAALPEEDLDPLGRCFAASAEAHRGSREAFLAKLALLRAMTFAGAMPFSPEALDTYLKAYQAADFPAVSHSEAYRQAYRPAYRIVLKEFWRNPCVLGNHASIPQSAANRSV